VATKNLGFVAVELAVLLMLGGCWGIPPIERAGLVPLLAIDAAPGGGFQVTAVVVTPPGAGSPGYGQSPVGNAVLLRQATAVSLADAVHRLDTMSYLDLDLTHLGAVIVSEDLARAGLAAPLAYLANAPETLTTSWLLVARGQSAGEVLRELQATRPQPGEVVVETVTDARNRTPYRAEHIFDFLDRIQLEGDDPTTAGVRVDPAAGGEVTTPLRLTGVALFRADRLVGWLDGDAALGWAVATGRVRHSILVVPADHGSFSVEILGARRLVRVEREGPGPRAEILVRATAHLTATQGVPSDFWRSPGRVVALRQTVEATLARDALAAVRAAQGSGADVFSLGQFVRVEDPADWKTLEPRWAEAGFRHIPVTVHVKVALQSVGGLACPVLGPC
jgi:spore germination protein KC